MSDRDSDSYFWTRQARDGGEFESPAAERDPEGSWSARLPEGSEHPPLQGTLKGPVAESVQRAQNS